MECVVCHQSLSALPVTVVAGRLTHNDVCAPTLRQQLAAKEKQLKTLTVRRKKIARSYPKNIKFNLRFHNHCVNIWLWILQMNNGNGFPNTFRRLEVGRDGKGGHRLNPAKCLTAFCGFSEPGRHGKTCPTDTRREAPAIDTSRNGRGKVFLKRFSLPLQKTFATAEGST